MSKIAAVCAMLLTTTIASAASGMAPAGGADRASTLPDSVAEQYAHPHQLIDVGEGRKINLFCMGSGGPTVVFDSGLSDWSVIWALVQPDVAKRTRACSYDRAGMGFSDAAAKGDARSPAAIVSDLHALIHAAKISTPVVLVGHSLGGFNMKLYAATYPDEVAGLVLVDPSEDRSYARTASTVAAKFGAPVAVQFGLAAVNEPSAEVAHYDACAKAADNHDLDPTSDLYKHCTDPVRAPLGPVIAASRRRVQVTAAYQDAQASELANSVYGDDRFDPVYAQAFSKKSFGAKPLIVLTHSIHDATNPQNALEYYIWNLTHEQTAALSTRGVNRIVPDTHHNIEIDRPQAVVQAVGEVLSELGTK